VKKNNLECRIRENGGLKEEMVEVLSWIVWINFRFGQHGGGKAQNKSNTKKKIYLRMNWIWKKRLGLSNLYKGHSFVGGDVFGIAIMKIRFSGSRWLNFNDLIQFIRRFCFGSDKNPFPLAIRWPAGPKGHSPKGGLKEEMVGVLSWIVWINFRFGQHEGGKAQNKSNTKKKIYLRMNWIWKKRLEHSNLYKCHSFVDGDVFGIAIMKIRFSGFRWLNFNDLIQFIRRFCFGSDTNPFPLAIRRPVGPTGLQLESIKGAVPKQRLEGRDGRGFKLNCLN